MQAYIWVVLKLILLLNKKQVKIVIFPLNYIQKDMVI